MSGEVTMPAEAFAIASIIREYSEDKWCAGWASDVEFELWANIRHLRSLARLSNTPTRDVPYFGPAGDTVRSLAVLSDHADGFVTFGEHGERFVTIGEMERLYAEYEVKGALMTLRRWGIDLDDAEMVARITMQTEN